MILQSLVELNNSISVCIFAPKFRWRPKKRSLLHSCSISVVWNFGFVAKWVVLAKKTRGPDINHPFQCQTQGSAAPLPQNRRLWVCIIVITTLTVRRFWRHLSGSASSFCCANACNPLSSAKASYSINKEFRWKYDTDIWCVQWCARWCSWVGCCYWICFENFSVVLVFLSVSQHKKRLALVFTLSSKTLQLTLSSSIDLS